VINVSASQHRITQGGKTGQLSKVVTVEFSPISDPTGRDRLQQYMDAKADLPPTREKN
jgi:hypothetical protein